MKASSVKWAARAPRPFEPQWHACESALDLHLELNESTGGVADAPTITKPNPKPRVEAVEAAQPDMDIKV